MTKIISYRQTEDVEDFRPKNMMNFQTKSKNYSIVLMLAGEDAPYHNKISEDGKTIDYVGHKLNKRYCNGKDSNTLD